MKICCFTGNSNFEGLNFSLEKMIASYLRNPLIKAKANLILINEEASQYAGSAYSNIQYSTKRT